MPDRTTCRVCEGTPLVGYYGLCQECQDATERFWHSRSLKAERQRIRSEREAKDDAIRNRPPQPRPDPDAPGDGVEREVDVQPTPRRRGGKPGGAKPRKRIQRSSRRTPPL